MRKKATGYRHQASGWGVGRFLAALYTTRLAAGWVAVVVVCSSACLAGAGCKREAKAGAGAGQVELTLDPSPPVVGDSRVTVTISDAEGDALRGATVRLEGNMNHAGMRPSFADLEESGEGRYVGTLDFTMAGDWYVVVTAKLADGGKVEQIIDVPGVRK